MAPRSLVPIALSLLLLAACGGGGPTPSSPHSRGEAVHDGGAAADPASGAPGGSEGNPAPSGLPTQASTGVTGLYAAHTGSTQTSHPSGTAQGVQSTGGSHGSSTAAPSAQETGGCPDPRYCADYQTLQGDATWPRDASGSAVIHYRINLSRPGSPTQLSDAQVVAAVQQLARTWNTADPSVSFAYDGTTTDQAIDFNNVVGFSAAAANGAANIPVQVSSDGRTITGFDIQLSPSTMWLWQPCDGASTPCDPYPGTGVDLGSIMAHSWGHALGLVDFDRAGDGLLTDVGSIIVGPDCGGRGQPVCRYAATLGLGDVLGARHLYPTSAAMPRIVYDQ